MKKLLLSAVVLFSLFSCNKVLDLIDDVPLPPGVDTSKYVAYDTSCQFIAQSSAYIEQEPRSQFFGFRKVINATTGKVDSLITAIGGTFDLDSFFYSFEYVNDSLVHIEGVNKTYNRLNSPREWELDNASMISEDVQFDANGNAKAIVFGGVYVGVIFNYENGVLKTINYPASPEPYNKVVFSYDDNGNLLKMVKGDDKNNFTVSYAYNSSGTARTQIYSTTYDFHLFEIMGWIPVMPKNLRTGFRMVNRITGEDLVTRDEEVTNITYSNHVVDDFGVLKSFSAHIDNIDLDTTITNTASCAVTRQSRLPL